MLPVDSICDIQIVNCQPFWLWTDFNTTFKNMYDILILNKISVYIQLEPMWNKVQLMSIYNELWT